MFTVASSSLSRTGQDAERPSGWRSYPQRCFRGSGDVVTRVHKSAIVSSDSEDANVLTQASTG